MVKNIYSQKLLYLICLDTGKYHIYINLVLMIYRQKCIQQKLIMQTTSRKLINISTTTIKMTDFSITYLSKGQLYPLCGLFFLLFIYWLDIDFFFSWCSIFRFFLVSSSDLFVSFMALATCLISPHHPGLILYSHRE